MSKFRCTCGHVMSDTTDFLPYKSHIREDEDTQKPIELLADILAQFCEARERGQEAEFIRQFERSELQSELVSESLVESLLERTVQRLAGQPLSDVLFHLIFPFWTRYDRIIYECEACGRLWVQVEGGNFVSYHPETSTRHVLWSRYNHDPYGPSDK